MQGNHQSNKQSKQATRATGNKTILHEATPSRTDDGFILIFLRHKKKTIQLMGAQHIHRVQGNAIPDNKSPLSTEPLNTQPSSAMAHKGHTASQTKGKQKVRQVSFFLPSSPKKNIGSGPDQVTKTPVRPPKRQTNTVNRPAKAKQSQAHQWFQAEKSRPNILHPQVQTRSRRQM